MEARAHARAQVRAILQISPKYVFLNLSNKNPKSAVPDGKALLFGCTQLGHNVSLLISLANEGGEVKGESSWIPGGGLGVKGSDFIS